MKKVMTGWLAALALACLSIALPAHAQLAVGQDYTVIEPAQRTDDPSRIEVVEFFPTVVRTAANSIHTSANGRPTCLPMLFSSAFQSASIVRNGPIWPDCITRLKSPVMWLGLTVRFFAHCTTRASS